MSAQAPAAAPQPTLGSGIDLDRAAVRVAIAGAVLGVLVGLSEVAIGASIRDWFGDKQDTTGLGLTTVALSLLAAACAGWLWRAERDRGSGGRVGAALGLLVTALICLSTAGRLWYMPGAMLFGSGALLLARTSRTEWAAAFTENHWRTSLLAACGVYYVFLGATALGVAGLLGVLGGLAMWTSGFLAASRSPRLAYLLLVGGAVPFAAATWWTGVTPLIALLSIACGRGVIAHAAPVQSEPRP